MTNQLKTRLAQLGRGEVPEGYQRTKVGVVPNEWKRKSVSACLGKVEVPVEVEKESLYTQIGIRSHGKGLFHKEPVTGESLGNKSVFWIQPNCFIVNVVFAWERAVGKTMNSENGMIGSHRFPMYKPLGENVDIDYLIYYFMTRRGQDILEEASPGGAGRNRTLGQERFMKSKVMLPPLPEQQKIAAILSAQDKLIQLKEKLVEEKKVQKKYLMQQLLTGKVRLKGFKGEWESIRLGDICTITGGGTPDTKQESYWQGDLPWVSSSDIIESKIHQIRFRKYISEEAVKNSATKICPSNSILIVTRVGVGKVALAPCELCTSQDFTNIIFIKGNVVFFAYYLSCEMEKQAKNAQGTSIKGITVSEMKSLKIHIPCLLEQTAIANALTTADREIDFLQQELEQEKQKKKSLMQLLLTGIVRV